MQSCAGGKSKNCGCYWKLFYEILKSPHEIIADPLIVDLNLISTCLLYDWLCYAIMELDPESHFVIAIDGPAGSGKSSVAGIVAQELGAVHADSGAMYRTLTLALVRKLGARKATTEFGQHFEVLANQADFDPEELGCAAVLDESGKQSNQIDGVDVVEAIRTTEVTERIKYIADHRACRQTVGRMLREFAARTSLVVDGRDIASVVFPETPYKFYLDASVPIRAERRLLELKAKNIDEGLSQTDLEKQIATRDRQDRERPFGALRQASGSILIDTTPMDQKTVVQLILSHLQIKF